MSGEFSAHSLRYQPWLGIDAMIAISPKVFHKGGKGVRVELIEASSGELLAAIEKKTTESRLDVVSKKIVDGTRGSADIQHAALG